jgi:SAM-dependent methyltransferase
MATHSSDDAPSPGLHPTPPQDSASPTESADAAEPANSATMALASEHTACENAGADGGNAPSTGAAPSFYLLAHTAAEAIRQEQQHWIFYEALGNHHLAAMPACPLPVGARILDAGCGDGCWLRDVLPEWPEAIGIGVDLVAPAAPATTFSPPSRAIFVVGNFLAGLPFADGAFYLVHQRMLGAALPRKLWPVALAELVRVTAPGGWLECLEGGPVEAIPSDCLAIRRLQDFTDALAAQRGIALAMNAHLGDLFHATDGLDPASVHMYNLPLTLTLRHADGNAEGLRARAARNWLEARRTLAPQVSARGWSDADAYAALIRQAEDELRTRAVRWPIHVAYARRAR